MSVLTTSSDLFQAILDNPDDDTIRLIYADLLDDESGTETDLAAFIRLQIALSKNPNGTSGDFHKWNAMKRREHELLCKNHFEWCEPMIHRHSYQIDGTKVYLHNGDYDNQRREYECTFERGFLHSVKCRMSGWYDVSYGMPLCDGRDIIAKQPTIREVEIMDRQPVYVPAPADKYYWIAVPRHHVSGHEGIHNMIPTPISRLIRGVTIVHDSFEMDGFATAEESKRELLLACIRWARGETT